MFKVNNRETRRRSGVHWPLSVVFIVNFLTCFTPCPGVSIVNFENVIAGWAFLNVFYLVSILFKIFPIC